MSGLRANILLNNQQILLLSVILLKVHAAHIKHMTCVLVYKSFLE